MYAIRQRVNDLYFGILILESQVLQNEVLQSVLKSNLERIESNRAGGTAMESDADAMRAELLTAQQQCTAVRGSIQAYRQMLSEFVGSDLADTKLLIPPMVDAKIDNGDNRPEMRLLDSRYEELNTRKLTVKASLMPSVGAFVQGYYGNPGFDMFDATPHIVTGKQIGRAHV